MFCNYSYHLCHEYFTQRRFVSVCEVDGRLLQNCGDHRVRERHEGGDRWLQLPGQWYDATLQRAAEREPPPAAWRADSAGLRPRGVPLAGGTTHQRLHGLHTQPGTQQPGECNQCPICPRWWGGGGSAGLRRLAVPLAGGTTHKRLHGLHSTQPGTQELGERNQFQLFRGGGGGDCKGLWPLLTTMCYVRLAFEEDVSKCQFVFVFAPTNTGQQQHRLFSFILHNLLTLRTLYRLFSLMYRISICLT